MAQNPTTIQLTGRIDTNNAAAWEKQIMEQLAPDTDTVFDAEQLEYISSAGLRVLMRARKQLKADMRIINVSPEVYDIFDMTGFTEMFTIEKQFRSLSVEGCEVIGRGFFGVVYRLDPETIVKVYPSPDSLPMIRNEQHLAKRAFVKGVPTAIPYDIVKVGDYYGSVFELLDAKSFNDLLKQEPEHFDQILEQYVDFLKVVHGAVMDPDTLPMARNIFFAYLDAIKPYLPDSQYDKLHALIEAVPEDLHMVHCDFQMKNVMLVGDEPMLIDMDTLATGQPIFDLQALYVTYVLFGEDDPNNMMSFLGLPNDMGAPIWNRILSNYFGTTDKAVLAPIEDKIRLLASLRFLYLITSTDLKDSELGQKRIRRSQNYITELIDVVKDLMI